MKNTSTLLKSILVLTCLIAWRFCFQQGALADVTVPYADGFENGLNTNTVWNLSTNNTGSGASSATAQTTTKLTGSYGLKLTNVNCFLNVLESQNYTNIWVQVYAKPAFFADEPTLSDVTAAFYVSSNGTLRAYARTNAVDGWTNLTSSMPADSWIGFAAHIHYSNQTWDLFYTTNGYGTTMRRANGAPMAFVSSASNRLYGVSIESEPIAYVDAVAVSLASTTNAASTTNVLSQERAAGTNTTRSYSGIPPRNYTAGDDSTIVYGSLGNDMKQGLNNGDEILVYYTNGWNRYQLNGGSWQFMSGISNLQITATMGLLTIRGASSNVFAFYPNMQRATPADPTLYGTNNSNMAGWNLLSWPYLESRTANSVKGWGFSSALLGDMIYIKNNNRYVKLWWDTSSGGRWKQSAAVSGYSLSSGQSFWYYCRSGGTVTWNIDSVE